MRRASRSLAAETRKEVATLLTPPPVAPMASGRAARTRVVYLDLGRLRL